MKIEKVIFTIDNNPHYKGFWSSISKHYNQKLKIKPKLFIIGRNVDVDSYDSSNGEIEVIESIEGIPTIIQALIGKFYFTITEPETTWKIGDLDLYPLQRYHFFERIQDISDDKYVHLNPWAYGKDWRNTIYGLAGYFHVAKGKVFETELNFKNKSFEDVCKEIYQSDKFGIKFHNIPANRENENASENYGWFCAEEMYTGHILKNSTNLIELEPIEGNYNRLDRSNMIYNTADIEKGHYIDFHSPRPYESHFSEIEKIISYVQDK
jgi:hypothetical protein